MDGGLTYVAMDILVVGAGSLGSLIGGLLARRHDVTLVGRDPHMSRVAADGLRITGLAEEAVRPTARTDATGLSSELALVTVKSYDTTAAAEALATGTHGAVCSLQNGLGNEEVLAEILSCPVIGGTATYGADLVEPGIIRMTGVGTVTIGRFRNGDATLLEEVAAAFLDADVNVEATDDIRERLWLKLAINAAINPVTALARCRNGAIAETPLSSVAEAAAAETVAVTVENGIVLDRSTVEAAVFSVAEATAENRSSMLQDVLEGDRTEIDAINGAVVDRAGDTAVPVNETLSALVRGVERAHTQR